MRPIDKSDMRISTIDCLRKAVKWYRKAFLHLIDICMLNVYVLYTQQHEGTTMSLLEFERGLIMDLFKEYRAAVPQVGAAEVRSHQLDRLTAKNYIGRHYLHMAPTLPSGRQAFRHCTVLSA